MNSTRLKRTISVLSIAGMLATCVPCHAGGEKPKPYSTPAEKAAFDQRARRLGQLWLARRKRNVTLELVRMLQAERTAVLRERLVIALGRLEDPQALESLEQMRSGKEQNSFKLRVSPFRLQLAIGRIRARNLRGKAKVNAVAKAVGMTWPKLKTTSASLRADLQTPEAAYAIKKDERFILEEFYDLFYRMGKNGEDIRALGAFDLQIWGTDTNKMPEALYSYSQTLLNVASLSDAQEVKFWLSRATPPKKSPFDPSHLLDLGPTVPTELKLYLREVAAKAKTNPKIMARTRAYQSAFEAASFTGDTSYLPLLRPFLNTNEKWTRIYAARAINSLNSGGGVIAFP